MPWKTAAIHVNHLSRQFWVPLNPSAPTKSPEYRQAGQSLWLSSSAAAQGLRTAKSFWGTWGLSKAWRPRPPLFYGLPEAGLAGGRQKQELWVELPGSAVPWPSNSQTRNRFIPHEAMRRVQRQTETDRDVANGPLVDGPPHSLGRVKQLCRKSEASK